MEKRKYTFNGAIYQGNRLVANNWIAQTYAVSEKKARSNFLFQFKHQNGYLPSAVFTLVGNVYEA